MTKIKYPMLLILVLSASNGYAYDDCPKTKNWLKDSFCQLTGGLLHLPNYSNMKNGIFHNPFAPYDGHGNKYQEGQSGSGIQTTTEEFKDEL